MLLEDVIGLSVILFSFIYMAAQYKTIKDLVTEVHFNRLFLQVMKTSTSVVFSGQVVISHSSAGPGNKEPF